MIVIYDDKCGFCYSFIKLINSRIKKINFISISVRSENAKKNLRSYGITFIELNTIFLIKNNTLYSKSTAIFLILKQTKLPLKLIAIFSLLPTKITDKAYIIFAKNRHKFSKFFRFE